MVQLLSAVSPGTLVKLNESGSPVEFYVAAQNYESGLNGAGRTLLVRKDVYRNDFWNPSGINTYANSAIDQLLNGAYKARLDPCVQTAIGTTTFYYTPGNGNYAVTTLGRPVFALSLTELGVSHPQSNNEGQGLPISSTLKIAYLNGEAVVQWTRSPINNSAREIWAVKSSGQNIICQTTQLYGSRPCFTLPNNLYVKDNGNAIVGFAPASITTPALIATGNSVPVSWDGVSGADSYILQRKADNGGWTQVYAGPLTTFTDTAGSWTTVQYQVCGVFDGTNGFFAQSDVITVLPAPTLVISGADGDLGTITTDIPCSVETNTGNQISLTRTVNGVLVASLTVDSGFAYSIPVMDLPTGTGTIVITATVQTSSGPVTAPRTWTYTKQAQTFPTSGGVAQLAKDGQNVFPLTLAEAVKAIGGPWGGNLSTALDKLAKAAVFNWESTTAGDFADLWGNIIPIVKIEVGSYVGTGVYGSSNANILNTPFPPKIAFITAESGTDDNIASGFINFLSGHYSVFHVGGSSPAVGFGQCSVEENTSKWWATGSTSTVKDIQDAQFNVSGVTYSYIIFG